MLKHRKKEKTSQFWFWPVIYPASVFVGLLFLLLCLLRRVKVVGKENLPSWDKGFILASNHPSLWEPILLVGLFFPKYFFHPIKTLPWSTPDKGNYWDKWYWAIFRARFVPVPRGNGRGEFFSLNKIIQVLRSGGKIIFFPEGGRTGRSNGEAPICLSNKKMIRPLKKGIGRIMTGTGCFVVPVWVDGTDRVLPIGSWFPRLWRPVVIRIGKPICSEKIVDPSASQIVLNCDRVFSGIICCSEESQEV